MNENNITQDQSQPELEPELQSEAHTQAKEEVKTDTQEENTQTEQNQLRNRLISMLVLAVSLGVAGSVLLTLIFGQALFSVFTKEPNDSMKALAKQLTSYVYNTLQYLSFNSEERSFPYQTWDEKKEEGLVRSENSEQAA